MSCCQFSTSPQGPRRFRWFAGEPKVGALKGVRVVKVKVGSQQLLLAYQFDPKRNVIEVLDAGPPENFYRDLQKYLDAR